MAEGRKVKVRMVVDLDEYKAAIREAAKRSFRVERVEDEEESDGGRD